MATTKNPAEEALSGLSIRQVSKEEMRKRTALFKELKSSREAFVDSLIPGGEREIFNVIGAGVTEDPSLSPAITAVEDFNLTFVRAEPGKGASLHYHPTVEVFMTFSGKWAVFWGDNSENEVILEPLDVVSVPPGVMRGFRNAGDETGVLIRARRDRRRPRHVASKGARGREADAASAGRTRKRRARLLTRGPADGATAAMSAR